MKLSQAERTLDEIAVRQRHAMLALDLIRPATSRAEAARLLRIAADMMNEAREIEDRAKRLLLADRGQQQPAAIH